MPQTTAQTLKEFQNRLAASHPELDGLLEGEVLLAHLLGKPRSHLFAWPDKVLTEAQSAAFEGLAQRRLQGEPIAYITGHREFWSLDLKVTPATLIPRPETELLVELALELIPEQEPWTIVDLGTGSGAIAAAVATECPGATLVATDHSPEALAVAHENFRRLGLNAIQTFHGSWLDALPPEIVPQLILSNPPYIADADPHLDQGDLPFEPRQALAAGKDGLDDLRLIVEQSKRRLAPGGYLLFEHGYDQGERARALLTEAGYIEIERWRDLGGQERVTGARRP
jgi:release factor glutamine methyltransferase